MPSERMTYPHRQRASGFPICLCGAMPGAGPTSTWGADCPVAMRERIGELEAESDKRNAQIDAARERIAELEATRSPTLSPAAFDTIVALGFCPGTANPVGWLMGEARRLRAARDEAQTTLRDLRAQLDYIAHVGWDASCEAAAADALEAEDATRLNRYAVRVAAESTRLRDLVRHQRGAPHDVELITDEEYAALAGDHAAVARLEGYDALRARVERLEGERDEARTAALREAAAVLRELAREHIDRTIRSGNYMSALTDATARIEALTTPARESEPARVDDVEGDL